jgi:hypothetical protein
MVASKKAAPAKVAAKQELRSNFFGDVASKDKAPREDVHAIIEWAEALTAWDGQQKGWDEFLNTLRIGYSRAWLIARLAYVQKHQPELLVDSAKLRAEAVAAGQDPVGAVTRLVRGWRDSPDGELLSWGEIMVRLQMTEGAVRKAYRFESTKKDIGLRIGKGGKFAYGAGELYTENRKKEGAHIPTEVRGRPAVEQLLNYIPKEGVAKKAPAKRTAKQVAAARRPARTAKKAG